MVGGGRRRREQVEIFAEIKRDATRALRSRLEPAPHELARGKQLIEIRGREPTQARREDLAFEHTQIERRTLEPGQRSAERVESALALVHAVQTQQKAGVRRRVDRLHLLAECGERTTLDGAHYLHVAVTGAVLLGVKLAGEQAAALDGA